MDIDMHDHAAVERRLWDEIEKHSVGMLGVTGDNTHHTQPMTAFVEPRARQLWFFVGAETALAHDIVEGRSGMFVFQRDDIQACISGDLQIHYDRARIDRYWNAVVAAWWPGGKDDPNLTLIRMDCDEAQVWLARSGPARFAWEIAKANATKHAPDVGGHASLRFH